MREILFRGKRTDNEEWVEGFYQEYPKYYVHIQSEYNDWFPVFPETVSQYIGLKDRDGQKIFEGDIVEYESHGYIPITERGVVIFEKGCFGIEHSTEYGTRIFHRIGQTSEWRDMGASGIITYTYKIIGNIHDNPELLKGD